MTRPLPPDEGEAFSSNSVYALIGSVVSEDQENYHPGQSSSNNPYSSLNDFDVVRMPPDKRQILSHNVAGGDKDVGSNQIEPGGDESPVKDVRPSKKRKIIHPFLFPGRGAWFPGGVWLLDAAEVFLGPAAWFLETATGNLGAHVSPPGTIIFSG
ncbi:hypothetical protein E8E15_000093 [Penicillium rubens]|nr:hypothetical protein E8E15_000093 [Penicillium rubens]